MLKKKNKQTQTNQFLLSFIKEFYLTGTIPTRSDTLKNYLSGELSISTRFTQHNLNTSIHNYYKSLNF